MPKRYAAHLPYMLHTAAFSFAALWPLLRPGCCEGAKEKMEQQSSLPCKKAVIPTSGVSRRINGIFINIYHRQFIPTTAQAKLFGLDSSRNELPVALLIRCVFDMNRQ